MRLCERYKVNHHPLPADRLKQGLRVFGKESTVLRYGCEYEELYPNPGDGHATKESLQHGFYKTSFLVFSDMCFKCLHRIK